MEKSDIKYLELLSSDYPTIQAACTEIINLNAILNLPKGTEHFISDIHGEYEAFLHILNNASGMIKEKIDIIFDKRLTSVERAMLATLIYYPQKKLEEIKQNTENIDEWYMITLNRLIEICKLVASKYTRSKVRKALPKDFEYIIDEMLNTSYDETNKELYYEKILSTIIDLNRSEAFIIALTTLIKRLIVDCLHIVGDIFDRGANTDLIIENLINHHYVDIQWGNHDVLWMGAGAGSEACIATVISNCIKYDTLDMLEVSYGINLRGLGEFAQSAYTSKDPMKNMYNAIRIMQFKLEGQIIKRNKEFNMKDRLLLEKIDYDKKTIELYGKTYKLTNTCFSTINPLKPYKLTPEEQGVMAHLKASFKTSEKLQRHIRFLYLKGSIYTVYNNNLLFHGCVPLDKKGDFLKFKVPDCNVHLCGKEYMDYCDNMVRQSYSQNEGSKEKQMGEDFVWFLWCGRHSPLFGRDKITTFERMFIDDETTYDEPKNEYYIYYEDEGLAEDLCKRILDNFGISTQFSHIINGHMPVKSKRGENPVKANGKLILIDGGFCKAYHKVTGIAGYTMFYNSYGIRVVSHEPFFGTADAINNNSDIISSIVVYDTVSNRITVKDTDVGLLINKKIEDINNLLTAYKKGYIKERQ